MSYDDRNLYVAFIAKDDPSLIRARVAKRKQVLTDERITINIDTFHDHRHAYWFDVNPYAVQLDGIRTDGVGDDFSWKQLWYTDAKITEEGCVVLMTIPFKTLRFPDTETPQWASCWTASFSATTSSRCGRTSGGPNCRSSDGLDDISPGRKLRLIPNGLLSGAHFLNQAAGGVPKIVTERIIAPAEMIIKDAFMLDMTLNPDFSQVESDEPQVTVNQRYDVLP